MKKLESTCTNMVLVLTFISVLAGGVLAYVNKVTEGPIKEINEKNLQDGIKKVVGDENAQVQNTQEVDGAVIYTTDKGVAVQTSDPNGFGGTLSVLVGFDAEGNIKGYTILESHETPGLGAKADTWFQEGSKGSIIGKNPDNNNMTVSKDGGEVDAITASTITSRAFLRCVNAAYTQFKGGDTNADAQSGASQQYNK